MRYIIPLVDGVYTEGDSSITTEGTRNDSATHKVIVALNGAPADGKLTIQFQRVGSSRWEYVDYTNLSEVDPQKIEFSGSTTKFRFIVEGASGTGTAVISDTERGEALTPYGLFGETNGMTPDEIRFSLRVSYNTAAGLTIPSFLSATASETTISLSWTNPSSVSDFNLYRNGLLVGTVVGATTYEDSGLDGSTAYNYTVKPIVDGLPVDEAESNTVRISTVLFTGYDVILLAGQSNMVGRTGPIDPVLDATDVRIDMYGFDSQTIKIASDPLDQVDETANTVGPGLSIAKYYADNVMQAGRKVLLVPVADGGTAFGTGYWRAGGDGYDNAVARCNAALSSGTGNNSLAFVAWHQGESDRTMTETEYRTEIDNLISGFRNDITGAEGVPFVLGGVNSNSTQYSDGVFKATYSRQLAGDGVAFVSTEDLPLSGDSLHFSAASSRSIGERYGAALDYTDDVLIEDFENDIVSQPATGLTALGGAVANVVDSGSSVLTGNYVSFSGSSGEEGFAVDGAPVASDQIVQMRIDSAGIGRIGVMLRHSGGGASFSGYLLQVNPEFDNVRVYRTVNGAFTLLGSSVSIDVGLYSYWRFWSRGNTLVIDRSADGVEWQEVIRRSDSDITGAGGVAIFTGFATLYTGLYIDDIRVGRAVVDA